MTRLNGRVALTLVPLVGIAGVLLLPADAVYGWSLLSYGVVGVALIRRCRIEQMRPSGFWMLVLGTIFCALALDVVRGLLTLGVVGANGLYARTALSVLALVLGSLTAIVGLGPAARHASAYRWGDVASLFIVGLGIDVWRTLLQHEARVDPTDPAMMMIRVLVVVIISVAVLRMVHRGSPVEGLASMGWLGIYFLLAMCAMVAMDLAWGSRTHSMIRVIAGACGLIAMTRDDFRFAGRLAVLDRGRTPLSDWRRVMSAAVMLNPLVAWLVLYGYRSRLAVSVGVVGLAGLWLVAIAATSRSRRSRLGHRTPDVADAGSAPANVLIEKLAGALIDNELELHYQPVVDVASAEIVGAEALLRWTNTSGAGAAPAHVLHLARVGGISRQLEAWILERALRDAGTLASELVRPDYLGINVTAAQLERVDFADEVLSLLANLDLPSGFIVLELTEYEALVDWDAARRTMQRLQAQGVEIALDDYGTGVANLQALTELSFDVVKLDRTFVIGSPQPEKAMMLDESLRAVQTLGVKIVLEGVEDSTATEVIDLVNRVDLAQGYAYGHPMPLPDLETLIATSAS